MADYSGFLLTLAQDSEENALENTPFLGAFHGAQGIIGIVLIIVGLLIIYFGIKVVQGYKFLPQKEAAAVKEDNFTPYEAKVLQRKKTSMPALNGGEPTEFIEWKIGYEIDGTKYIQMIPDNGYAKGDFLKIRYNPENPEEYYLDTSDDSADRADDEQTDTADEKNPTGWLFSGIGLLIAVVGLMLAL